MLGLTLFRHHALTFRAQSVGNSTAEWKAQLAIFEANLHASSKTEKKPMPRNTANVNQLIDSLKAYEEQQPMLKVLYAELHHYQSLIATAIQHGAFLNPSMQHSPPPLGVTNAALC